MLFDYVLGLSVSHVCYLYFKLITKKPKVLFSVPAHNVEKYAWMCIVEADCCLVIYFVFRRLFYIIYPSLSVSSSTSVSYNMQCRAFKGSLSSPILVTCQNHRSLLIFLLLCHIRSFLELLRSWVHYPRH